MAYPSPRVLRPPSAYQLFSYAYMYLKHVFRSPTGMFVLEKSYSEVKTIRDQITNVGMIRHVNSEDTRTLCPTYGLTETGTTFNGSGKFCEPLGGFGACSPRKCSNLKALKHHFQHSQADSCVKKIPKIDFLL